MKGKLKKIYSLPLCFNLTYIHSTDPLSQYVDNQLQMSVREKSKFLDTLIRKYINSLPTVINIKCLALGDG